MCSAWMWTWKWHQKLSNAITIIIHCVNYNELLGTGHLFRKINLKLTQTAAGATTAEARPLKSLLWFVSALIGNYVVVASRFFPIFRLPPNSVLFPIICGHRIGIAFKLQSECIAFALSVVTDARAHIQEPKSHKIDWERGREKEESSWFQLRGDKWFLIVVFNYFFRNSTLFDSAASVVSGNRHTSVCVCVWERLLFGWLDVGITSAWEMKIRQHLPWVGASRLNDTTT